MLFLPKIRIELVYVKLTIHYYHIFYFFHSSMCHCCHLKLIPTSNNFIIFYSFQLAITWRRIVWSLGLWDSVREFARMYDAGMGMIIFAPIAFLSWFPFISTFQSRLLFNQAFSRGLEISLILAGNKANVES